MTVRLLPNLGIDSLAEQLNEVGAPCAVGEVDLTNCVHLDPDQLTALIQQLTHLRSLRCLSCPLRPSDLYMLLLQRLSHLVEVEFSLVSETGAESELERMQEMELQNGTTSLVPDVRSMYVEVGNDQNFQLLSMILHSCPKLDKLHVHFVRGTFSNAVRECRQILAERTHLKTFTFTSEVPTSLWHDYTTPLGFTSCAAACANVSHTKPTDSWSFVRFRDLALRLTLRFVAPFQLVVVATALADYDMAQFIRDASRRHVWGHVRELCLVLLPAEASSVAYPMAGLAYREGLCRFFSKVFANIVELNISSFHFDPEMDLADALPGGSPKHLQSLSASLCCFYRSSTLHHVVRCCPDFKDLDVRVDRKGRLQPCAVCIGVFASDPDFDREFSSGPTVLFHRGLARLTLTNLPYAAYVWFVESCGPTPTVRLSDCSPSWDIIYAPFVQMLVSRGGLSCLVLEGEHLDFTEEYLLGFLSSAVSLEYLYLLSEKALGDNAVASIRKLCTLLPQLMCVHIHYRSLADDHRERRSTWMRGQSTAGPFPFIVERGTCLNYCSTATFAGLAKPLNRQLKPIL